jgi:serine/threonine-protein kinase
MEDGAGTATYIAMELVEGESLGELLDRVRVLNATDAASLLAPVARALAYAHANNVVHRDVKPSNILLRRAAPAGAVAPDAVRLTVVESPVTPLLSDFGIARALDAPDLTSAGRTIGTPAYMSPEQCAGSREITGRADIYSLGAVLYRALVGRSPFSGTTTQILYAHVYEPLTIPEEVLLTLPPLLVEVLRRSMAKEPALRYADAGQMADDLLLCVGRPQAGTPLVAAASHAEATATMANLDAAAVGSSRRETPPSSVVLVPAPAGLGAGRGDDTTPSVLMSTGGTAAAVGGLGAPAAGPAGAVTVSGPAGTVLVAPPPLPVPQVQSSTIYVPPPDATAAATTRRVRGLLVAASLAILIFALLGLAVAALLNVGPFGVAARPGGAPSAPTGAQASGTLDATLEPNQAAAETGEPAEAAAQMPAPQATSVDGFASATPAATAEPELAAVATPAERPTPAGDIAGFWEEARAFYDDRDWGSALNWLTLVQRIDAGFEQAQVERMLAETYVALGTQANRRGDTALAEQQLERALVLQPQNLSVRSVLSATQSFAQAEGAGVADAQRLLQIAHAAYGERLLRENRVCDAADQLAAAAQILPESRSEAAAADARQRCAVLEVARADQRLLENLSGRLIYSTQLPDGRFAIYVVATAPGSTPSLLLENARQPALSADGQWLAFHQTLPGQEGLARIALNQNGVPEGPIERLTTRPGDAADSPPAWNFAGTELVYAGIDPTDERGRVYRLDAMGGGSQGSTPQVLANGQAPAWSWALDRIAYNGIDAEGRRPGLYLMRPDGGREGALTDNGNDTRPAWSPDGDSLLFMSSGRSPSWDVFRLNLADRGLAQVTSDQAQDGLPVFSPDGRFVAWVSDRGGRWNIWVKALNPADAPAVGGGPPGAPREILLAPVEGSLTNWLEHTLIWAP